ncbi:MAG: signal peptidase II [Ignavibacteria bacterium]|nr:signal peptidase II [Ignavibacteria bacterium]
MKVLYVTFVMVFIDQITKFWVKGFSIPFLNLRHEGMYYGQSINVIGDFFQLTFVENPGMAFGVDVTDNAKLWLSLFSIVASIGLFVYLYSVRKQSLSLRIALSMILAGALGNLIDRVFYGVFYTYSSLFYGKVVDFFDFDFFDFQIFGRTYDRWPIFNVADMCVSIGVLILLLFYKQHQQEHKEISITTDQNVEVPEQTLQNDETSDLNENTLDNEKVNNDKSDNREEIQN